MAVQAISRREVNAPSNQKSTVGCRIDIFLDFLFLCRLNGAYNFNRPIFVIREPETIKQLTIKDFEYFENHQMFIDSQIDELFGNSLFLMEGEKWRDMRSSLSPAFTGSKMRQMFELVSLCAEDMVAVLREESNGVDMLTKEFKDLFVRYTTDVIATTAFGLETNSLRDKDNEFLLAGRNILQFEGFKSVAKILIQTAFPWLAKAMDLQLIDAGVREFFKSVVFDTMETRERENIFRPDIINILMQMRRGQVERPLGDEVKHGDDGFATVEESNIGTKIVHRKWTDIEILAQSFVFFFAGLDTSSNALLFTAYELALNTDIQTKLFDEIHATDAGIDGNLVTYDLLQKMKYLDQVICESLRKWPPVGLADRICVKDYVYDDGNGKKFQIEEGVSILIPTYGLHRDEQFYPNPEKFDPERFSDDNKKNILPGSYLPFGIGPRNCIGSRFALMEVKAILYYLLLHFSIEVCEQTVIPLKFKKSPMALKVDHDVFLHLRPRH